MNRKYLLAVVALAATLACGCSSPAPSELPTASASAPTNAAPTSQMPTVTRTPAPSSPVAVPAPHTTNYCQAEVGGWDERDDSTDVFMTRGEIIEVRTGTHRCFDRVVIEVDTRDRVGFRTGYVSAITRDGSGAPVSVDGAAVLRVVVDAPAGAKFAQCASTYDWASLRGLVCAGSFEGMTTFAIGLDHRVPFAAYHLANEAKGTMRIVIDFAHR